MRLVARKQAAAKKTDGGAQRGAVRKAASARRAAPRPPARATTWSEKVAGVRAHGFTSFPQRAGASPREAVLFELARARTAVIAAVQGLLPGSAERPHAEGKWNTRQHVLHLVYCDQVYVADLDPAERGELPPAASHGKADDDRVNAETLARLDHVPWDDALRMLHDARKKLLERIEALDPGAAYWADETHILHRILRSAALHDRHHADAIKRWRTESKT